MFPPRVPQAHDFPTLGGAALPYSHWHTALHRRGAIAIVQSHRHAGSGMQSPNPAALVEALDLHDFDFFAADIGEFDADASPAIGHLQAFVDRIAGAHGVPMADLFLIGHGDGAVALAAWAHDLAPPVRGLTLVAPTFEVRRPMPFARTIEKVKRAWSGPFFDERVAAVERVVDDAGAIACPVQLLIAGADRVAMLDPQKRFFDALPSDTKTRLDLPDAPHDVFGAPESATAVLAVRSFAMQLFDAPPMPLEAPVAIPRGAGKGAAPAEPPAWEPRRDASRWRAQLSNGIRLGLETGFDSGSALDYIYRAEPQGRGAIGRSIDARYLQTHEANALRERMRHVQDFVQDSMERLAERRRDVRLIDIAAGPGRYLLDAVRSSPVKAGAVLLRDISEAEMRAGQAWIARYEMQEIARYEKADAFDRMSLASIFPRPTIAIASGLYELFEDDEVVRRSLIGVGDAVQDGGFLIYTAAPWHPQPDRNPRRRRSQGALDRLVEQAGFRKIAQRGDVWGLQTVSLAVRTE